MAASNSIDNENADFICDGTDDHVEIQRAIDNLPSGGGSVYLREGTYSIGATINLNNNVALIGAGAGTLLYLENNVNDDVIYGILLDNLLIANLRIDGNGSNNISSEGIYISVSWKLRIEGTWIQNCYYDGIYLETCYYSIVINNILDGNLTGDGIFSDSGQYNNFVGNILTGNGLDGITVQGGSWNTVTGNTADGNTYDGISLWGFADFNTITGNTSEGNGEHGIGIGSTCTNNTISGNTIEGNGQAGINLINYCDHNTISNNTIVGNSQTTNNVDNGIQIKNSSYTNIQGNTVRRGTGSKKQNTGITILSGTSNFVANNDLYQAGAAENFSDAGTGTIFDYSQSGLAENVVPIDSSGFKQNITITFPVSFPSVPRVIANLANFDNDAAVAYIVQIETITTDNFTIRAYVDTAATGDADVIWYATVASQSGGRE